MSSSIKRIKAPIESELREFEKRFREVMRSKVPLLDRITYYIVKRKGKQIRPIFVFLSALNCGRITPSTYDAAALVELLHTATLVHDDVVDDADRRRGFFSINALWKNKVAVLVGDYLLSRGLLLALDNEEYDLLQIVSKAVREMSEGELLQMEKARKLDIDEAIYYDIIRQKTASLIAAACSAGASSSSEDPEDRERMRQFGEKLGMAFQIRDDLFDFGEKDVGKPRGIDIKEKKMTLPLIHVLNKADKKRRRWIINSIKHHNENRQRVNELIEYVRNNGGISYAREKMEQYALEARDILQFYPSSPARDGLDELVTYVMTRQQ